jgi:hypothetical protein
LIVTITGAVKVKIKVIKKFKKQFLSLQGRSKKEVEIIEEQI